MVKLMNAKEFAEESGFPVSLVRRYCRCGLIPCWKIGRTYRVLYQEAFEAMMKTREIGKPEPVGVRCRFTGRIPRVSSGKTLAERLKEL